MMIIASRFLALQLLMLISFNAAAAVDIESADQRAIRLVVLDYAEGWYQGDRGRMARSLHDALAKRIYAQDEAGIRQLRAMDKQQLLAGNKPENLARYATAPQRAEVAILDGFANAASVKLTMDDWVDYMHLVRDEHGQWRIINVLWELHPDDAPEHDAYTAVEAATGASKGVAR